MSHQQANDFCILFKHLLSKQIDEYQEMIDRYAAVNAENIYGLEAISREIRWRRYAIAGLKNIRKNLTPNTIARWLCESIDVEEETSNVTADNRPNQGSDQLPD